MTFPNFKTSFQLDLIQNEIDTYLIELNSFYHA